MCARRGLSLFTNFLLDGRKPGNKEIFSIYLAVHEQQYEGGHPDMAGHLEKVPLWSDYLIVEIELQPEEGEFAYTARYSWASESRTPNQPLEFKLSEKKDRADANVPVPARAFPVLGEKARLYLDTYDWE
jgi:hypothetical protein